LSGLFCFGPTDGFKDPTTFRKSNMSKQVFIYDTTLRDGNQAKGISFSLEDKLAIARKLDAFGVHYIEGGWPNPTNPTDVEFFRRAKTMTWKHAKIAAFGSTCRPNGDPANDPILKPLVESGAPVLTIFGKSWDLHVTEVLRTTLEENLRMIRESVAFLKKNCEEVVYDAEHFFDGYRANPDYALSTLKAAQDGGADCIVLCDTNGGMALSWELEEITARVRRELTAPLGIHVHNDTGTAVANSLAAVRAGATQVQGVMNGYGERCGNANLTTIIPDLQFKMGLPVVGEEQMRGLRALSLSIDETANLANDIRQPYVGEAAFAHKGGAHIDGVIKLARSFEHMDPALVGNGRDFVVSNQSGGSLIWDKIKAIKPDVDRRSPEVADVLAEVKRLEDEGYHFELAEGSFQLLARRRLGLFQDRFEFLGFRAIEEQVDGAVRSEFTLKLKVGEAIEHTAADGNGPVDAMNKAMLKALVKFFPNLKDLELADFKVRVLDNAAGAGAKVRVWTRYVDHAHPGRDPYGTIGVSTNIIEASWRALMDGIQYKLLLDGES
jgi:2-isopropylmalate synthase